MEKDKGFAHTYELLTEGQPTLSNRFAVIHQVLYCRLRNGKLATSIPDSMVIEVLRVLHDSSWHWGFEKTWHFFKQRFYRSGLSILVKEYIQSCLQCQRVKRKRTIGDMSPYEMALKAFNTISMNIILRLPLDNGFYACMVIPDQFSKAMTRRSPTSMAMADCCADLLFTALVSKGFLPSRLIPDRDPKLVSLVWDILMKRLKMQTKLISAYYQQGHCAESAFKRVQTLLRLYTSEDRWVSCRPFVVVGIHNTIAKSTGYTPNELLYIDRPRQLSILCGQPEEDDMAPQVSERVSLAQARTEQAADMLEKAMALQKKNYDARHIQTQLKAGDQVYVSLHSHQIRSLGKGMNKLQDNQWGPFLMTEMMGV